MTVDDEILAMLRDGPKRASEIGEALWGKQGRHPQHYARPAGRILHRLKAAGRVEQVMSRRRIMWRLA